MSTLENQNRRGPVFCAPSVQGTGYVCALHTAGARASRPFSLFQEGVEVRVARIFNTFGPRMHMNDGRVVSNFILQALQGEPLTVGLPGGCLQRRKGDLIQGLGFPEFILHIHVYLCYLNERNRSKWVEHRPGMAFQ